MPSYIIKADPDQDWYAVWSTIVDAPTACGSRAELERLTLDPRDVAAERFARADANGTSACWPDVAPSGQPYSWSDEHIGALGECGPPYREDGYYILPRANLREFCERGAGEDTADLLIFEPYDEEAGNAPRARATAPLATEKGDAG